MLQVRYEMPMMQTRAEADNASMLHRALARSNCSLFKLRVSGVQAEVNLLFVFDTRAITRSEAGLSMYQSQPIPDALYYLFGPLPITSLTRSDRLH